MKKTFNINISGYVFTIDDDAYDPVSYTHLRAHETSV